MDVRAGHASGELSQRLLEVPVALLPSDASTIKAVASNVGTMLSKKSNMIRKDIPEQPRPYGSWGRPAYAVGFLVEAEMGSLYTVHTVSRCDSTSWCSDHLTWSCSPVNRNSAML